MNGEDLWPILNELLEIGTLDIVGGKLSPPTPERKDEVAQLVPASMPDRLKTLLAAAHGAYLGSINLFSLDELEDVHRAQDHLFTYMPSVIFFASDGGDGFFFMDPDNTLGQGEGAIFWIYRGSTVPKNSVPCGEDLEAFLTSLAQGEEVWKGPSLEERAIAQMLETLDAHRDRWTGRQGAGLSDVLDIADRHRLRAPKVLEKLLRRSNGVVFLQVGIRIWGAQKIKRLEGTSLDGYQPLALLIGEDESGNAYAITHRDRPADVPQGWPCLEGWVIRLPAGQLLEEAETLGYLPDLVIEWVEA
jgi:hypothetical protein